MEGLKLNLMTRLNTWWSSTSASRYRWCCGCCQQTNLFRRFPNSCPRMTAKNDLPRRRRNTTMSYTSLDMRDQVVNDFVQCSTKNGLNIHKYFEYGWMFGGTTWEIKIPSVVFDPWFISGCNNEIKTECFAICDHIYGTIWIDLGKSWLFPARSFGFREYDAVIVWWMICTARLGLWFQNTFVVQHEQVSPIAQPCVVFDVIRYSFHMLVCFGMAHSDCVRCCVLGSQSWGRAAQRFCWSDCVVCAQVLWFFSQSWSLSFLLRCSVLTRLCLCMFVFVCGTCVWDQFVGFTTELWTVTSLGCWTSLGCSFDPVSFFNFVQQVIISCFLYMLLSQPSWSSS